VQSPVRPDGATGAKRPTGYVRVLFRTLVAPPDVASPTLVRDSIMGNAVYPPPARRPGPREMLSVQLFRPRNSRSRPDRVGMLADAWGGTSDAGGCAVEPGGRARLAHGFRSPVASISSISSLFDHLHVVHHFAAPQHGRMAHPPRPGVEPVRRYGRRPGSRPPASAVRQRFADRADGVGTGSSIHSGRLMTPP